MQGKIFITRSGYDPELGKHVKDPYLGPVPTLGACRPDVRKQLKVGDHIFVLSGKVAGADQFVMGGFEIAAKISAIEAYSMLPDQRLQQREDDQLTGNIIVNPDGSQHPLDDHNSFDRRIKEYVIGTSRIVLETSDERTRGREETLDALREILRKSGKTPHQVVGRFGSSLTEDQIRQLRDWLTNIKMAS